MRHHFTIVILFFFTSASGQKLFDSTEVEKTLMTLPRPASETTPNENVIQAIEAVDKKYRQIADTLYSYQSLRHTILQTIFIETNDSIFINPLSFGDKIHLTNIVFNNSSLNIKVDSVSKILNRAEKVKLFKYLESRFDNFSLKDKKLNAQPVRIRYVKFPDDKIIHVGIDIYGEHFLWTIDRNKSWDVIKVERLWIY
jgi:hypothetical protein